jgi:hypothetical protein
MADVKVSPSAANAFSIELYGFKLVNGKPVHNALLGVIECITDGAKIHILRRENEFASFKVIDNENYPSNRAVEPFDTHSLTLDLSDGKPIEQRVKVLGNPKAEAKTE